MKANKALKRLTHVEDLLSDVMERYSEGVPEIRQQLLDAKAAVAGAKDAVKLQASAEKQSKPKKASVKKAGVKVPPPKSTRKIGKTKRDYEA